MNIFGSWRSLVSAVFAKDSQAITLRPNQATTYTAARDIQLPPGDAAHVLQSADSTQTVSNKTLDNTNTATLKDTLFTVQDDADATKQMRFQLSAITSGQTRTFTMPDANSIILNNTSIQGVSNKSLDNTNDVTLKDTLFTLQDDGDAAKQARFQLSGITTGNTRVYTLFDASTTLLGHDTAQVVTAKDIDGGTASNTSRVTLPKAATATLNALTRKQGTIVYDTTTNKIKFDDGSTLNQLDTAVDASVSTSGQVNLSAQVLGIGLKTFRDGIVGQNTDETFGDADLDLSGRSVAGTPYKFVNTCTATSLTAARSFTLPTTDVKRGQIFRLNMVQITSPSITASITERLMAIKASGGTTIDSIQSGFIEVMALQDAPTANTHWKVVDLNEIIYVGDTDVPFTTGTTSGTGATNGHIGAIFCRNMLNVTGIVRGNVNHNAGSTGAGPYTTQQATGFIPSRLRVTTGSSVDPVVPIRVYDNDAVLGAPGRIDINLSNGNISLQKDYTPSAYNTASPASKKYGIVQDSAYPVSWILKN